MSNNSASKDRLVDYLEANQLKISKMYENSNGDGEFINNLVNKLCTNISADAFALFIDCLCEKYNSESQLINEVGLAKYMFYMHKFKDSDLVIDVKDIPKRAFWKADGIDSIKLINTSEIGYGAFTNSSIVSVSFSDNLINVGESAFEDCTYLKRVEIPGSLISLSNRMFANCYFLDEVILNEGVAELGDGCFNKCVSLEKIVLPSTIKLDNNFLKFLKNITDNKIKIYVKEQSKACEYFKGIRTSESWEIIIYK